MPMIRTFCTTAAAALCLLVLLAFPPLHQPLSAQTVTLDEGTFVVTMNGNRVGTETFFVRRNDEGEGGQIIAFGEIELDMPGGAVRLEPAVQASALDMGVSVYQVRIRDGQQSGESRFERESNRFRMTMQTEMGERQRELRAESATVFLDPQVAHQYWFVGQRIQNGQTSVPVIVPRAGDQFSLAIERVGSESVQIDGSGVPATRYRLIGSGAERHVWFDDEGRVLRVEHPDSGYVAIRAARP